MLGFGKGHIATLVVVIVGVTIALVAVVPRLPKKV